MVLTGKAGLGKTLLLRKLLEDFSEQKTPILVISPAVDPIGLLQLLLGELGITVPADTTLAGLLQVFQNHLLSMAEKQEELFIIIDEAQNMPIETLEQLRMLSNLETGKKKLMQILLVGQSELDDVLTHPSLGQLVQRIVVHEKLTPLDREQIAHYVSYRLGKAGRADIFLSKSGCKLLKKSSNGIPRLINRIMDRTLLLASVEKNTVLNKSHVMAAIRTMGDVAPKRAGFFTVKIVTSLVLLFVLSLLAAYFLFTTPDIIQTLSFNSPAAIIDSPLHSSFTSTETGGEIV